jgi:hypothetical protein
MAIYYKGELNIDGHCPFCHKQATFAVEAVGTPWKISDLQEKNGIEEISVKCARNEQHVVHFYIFKSKMIVKKIGQFPHWRILQTMRAKHIGVS